MELATSIGAALSGTSATATAATAAGTTSAAAAGTSSAALLAAPASSAAGFSAAVTTGGSTSIASLLSSGATLASTSLSIFSGVKGAKSASDKARAQAEALSEMTANEKLQARQGELAAKQSGNEVLDRLRRTLGAQRLAFSANGVDGDFGSAEAAARREIDLAGENIAITRDDTNQRILSRRRQSLEYARQRGIVLSTGAQTAAASRTAGILSGVETLGNYYERGVRRG